MLLNLSKNHVKCSRLCSSNRKLDNLDLFIAANKIGNNPNLQTDSLDHDLDIW